MFNSRASTEFTASVQTMDRLYRNRVYVYLDRLYLNRVTSTEFTYTQWIMDEWIKLHQICFAALGTDRCRSDSFLIVDISICSGNIRDRRCPKSCSILHVFGPHFWGECPLNFWIYIIKLNPPTSDHVEKIRAHRPRNLKDLALKKRHQQ